MMRTALRYTVVLALLGAGCLGDENADGSGQPLSAEDQGDPPGDGRGGPADVVVTTGEGSIVLDCVPGSVGEIHVVFECDAITIYSCKDLSNVVVEFEDGTRQRTEGLQGQTGTFSGNGDQDGQRIVGVWVKAGNNRSGDGPGYGQRFDAPEGDCEPPDEAGSGGSGGSGGAGGSGDTCEDNDPDTFCGEDDVPQAGNGSAGDGSSGSGGDNGGEPQPCADPDDPACNVE